MEVDDTATTDLAGGNRVRFDPAANYVRGNVEHLRENLSRAERRVTEIRNLFGRPLNRKPHYTRLFHVSDPTTVALRQSNYFSRGNYIPMRSRGKLFLQADAVNFPYMETMADRARALLKKVGPKKAHEVGGGNYDRWRSVSKGAVRVSTEEIDVLVQLFPQYALWLASGQVAPEAGQTSPEYDEANAKLAAHHAG